MKICSGKKSVMFAVNFTDPRWSRCARDGIKKLSGFSQGLNDGGLSRARWSGNDEENSVPAESHQIVILSVAKNPRLLSGDSRSRSPRCLKAWPHAPRFVAALRST